MIRRALLLSFLLLLAAPARAEERPSGLETRVGVDFASWSSHDASVLTLGLHGQLSLSPDWALHLDLPLAAGWLAGDASAHPGVGNITLGANGGGFAARWPGLLIGMWVGLAATVPTSFGIAPTNAAVGTSSVMTFASRANALMGYWRYLPEFGGGRISYTLEIKKPGVLRFVSDWALIVAVPLGAEVQGMEWWSNFESASFIEFNLPMDLLIGLRASLAISGVLKAACIAVEPYIGADDWSQPYFVHLGYLIGTPLSSDFPHTIVFEAGIRL